MKNTESFDVYRLFENSVPRYKDKFYFDVGFILDKDYYTKKHTKGYYSVLDFKNTKYYKYQCKSVIINQWFWLHFN